MTTIQNHSEYVSLVNTLKVYDYQYFTLNAPTISDAEYDRLYFMAQDYEQRTGDVLADSPTQSAHAEYANGHRQIARRTPMLSTEKAQTLEAVSKWMKRTGSKVQKVSKVSECLFTIEWKYDGVSCSLIYQDGQLIEATYGKGTEGNDCLALCKQIASIPNDISAQGRVEVRGEMLVPFANLPKTGYKNCRSAAAGIVADTQTTLAECLEFYPYWTDAQGKVKDSLSSAFCVLLDNGFRPMLIDFIRNDQIAGYIAQKEAERTSLPFPTDGMVIKVADMAQWDSLGQTAHHPKYAIAYKFAAATAETTITRIEITTGATGKRTPVAYFEPIVINGATYQKASVGSEAKLAELGIEVGSRVIVSLRNDVIPHIDGRVEEKPTLEDSLTTDNGQQTTDTADEDEESLDDTPEPVSLSPDPSPEDGVEIYAPQPADVTFSSTPHPTPSTINHKPSKPKHFRMADETVEQYKQRILRESGEIPTSNPSPTLPKGEGDKTTNKIIAGVLCAVILVGIGVLAFAGLGAAIFFLPLAAGALKS